MLLFVALDGEDHASAVGQLLYECRGDMQGGGGNDYGVIRAVLVPIEISCLPG